MNLHKLTKELGELFFYVKRQLLSQIPSISGVAGLAVGAWVASTFTTSPFKGFLASWGFIEGGTHVVTERTYKFLIVGLPILATAVTAYFVHKLLTTYRKRQLKREIARVVQLENSVQTAIQVKMQILESAKDAKLISAREFDIKQLNLYQSYTRTNSAKVKQIVLDRISS